MTRERAKELLHVYTAWIEGKTIMYKDHHGEWREIDHSIGLGMDPSKYKVVEEQHPLAEAIEVAEAADWFIKMVNEDADNDVHHERPNVPEYIVASTSYDACETLVFHATSEGGIVSYDDYGGIAARWDDADWDNAELAVKSCMPHTYQAISRKGNHVLFKLVTPDELTHWDKDESDKISY